MKNTNKNHWTLIGLSSGTEYSKTTKFCLSTNSCPILYSKLPYKLGQDFSAIQFENILWGVMGDCLCSQSQNIYSIFEHNWYTLMENSRKLTLFFFISLLASLLFLLKEYKNGYDFSLLTLHLINIFSYICRDTKPCMGKLNQKFRLYKITRQAFFVHIHNEKNQWLSFGKNFEVWR